MVAWLLPRVSFSKDFHLRVVTEDAYPLQYQEGGELKGPAVELIKAVLEKAEVNYSLEVLPWARAYAISTTQPNTLIFSIARTPQRESLFHWVGSLMELKYYLYGLASNFPDDVYIENDLKDRKVGTILDSATYQYLSKNGFSRLYAVANPKQNYEKLLSGRIELFPANAASFMSSCVKFGSDCTDIKPIVLLSLPATKLYFALNKDTDEILVAKIKGAYKNLLKQNLISAELKPELFMQSSE